MIQLLQGLPANMVGFSAEKEVTKEDFDTVVLPAADELVKRTGKLNYVLVLNTPISEFTIGAWWKDAWLGIKHLANFHRVAIVTDKESIRKFTDVFSFVIPGEFKGFTHEEQQQAIAWASANVE